MRKILQGYLPHSVLENPREGNLAAFSLRRFQLLYTDFRGLTLGNNNSSNSSNNDGLNICANAVLDLQLAEFIDVKG